MTLPQAIIGVINKFADMERSYEPIELANAIAKAIEAEGEITIGHDTASIRCLRCFRAHVIYRLDWREEYLAVLVVFERMGPLTTSDVGKLLKGQTARKVPSELVHFGLLEVCGTRGSNRLYRLTDHAKMFLADAEPTHESVWPEDAPEGCEPGPLKYRHQMRAKRQAEDSVTLSPPIHV